MPAPYQVGHKAARTLARQAVAVARKATAVARKATAAARKAAAVARKAAAVARTAAAVTRTAAAVARKAALAADIHLRHLTLAAVLAVPVRHINRPVAAVRMQVAVAAVVAAAPPVFAHRRTGRRKDSLAQAELQQPLAQQAAGTDRTRRADQGRDSAQQ